MDGELDGGTHQGGELGRADPTGVGGLGEPGDPLGLALLGPAGADGADGAERAVQVRGHGTDAVLGPLAGSPNARQQRGDHKGRDRNRAGHQGEGHRVDPDHQPDRGRRGQSAGQ